jgi:membrane associated rhomboid family serine protease
MPETQTQTCYRHPNRETGVSCSNCGRPICPECMTPTPVGMRCPECSRQRTKVVRNPHGTPSGVASYPVTAALIAINVVMYLIEVATGSGGLTQEANGSFVFHLILYGPFVSEGEWYRLLTAGFLHANIIHIGFNMVLLFFLGRLMEPSLGSVRFAFIYFASLLAGSFGALLLDPNTASLGASGAIFGLAGATFVIARGRGLDDLARQIGFLILINLVYGFAVTDVSVGAHLGGLVAGVIGGLAVVAGERGMLGPRHRLAELAAMVVIGAVSVFAAVGVA